MSRYVLAMSNDWFRRHEASQAFDKLDLRVISHRDELTLDVLREIDPRYVFFPHWNWIVPPEIFERYECVVFHTAPLPYGRGGSPIQNLILRGFDRAPVCALRMSKVVDGGPIYGAMDVSLEGTLDEIFGRIAECVEQLILRICAAEPEPKDQSGDPVHFRRLAEADNELPGDASLRSLYDRIRMLDGAGYPKAYLVHGEHRLEFSEASIGADELVAKVRITRRGS